MNSRDESQHKDLKSTKNDGLVFAYILDGSGGGNQIDLQGIRQWQADKGPLWIHLDYTFDPAKEWLQTESNLDRLSCDILMEDDTRPRFIANKDGFLLILRAINCNPGADPEDMVALRMSFEENRIITMRQRKVMAIDDIYNAIEAGNGPKSIIGFLTLVIDRMADRVADVINDIDDQVGGIEDTIVTGETSELHTQLSALRRQIIILRRYLAPQRDVLLRLRDGSFDWLSDNVKLRLRELSERMVRLVEDLDSARDRSAITQEELNSRLSNQINRTIYILSIITVVFLPLSFITGLLGINVGGIPGGEYKWAFLIVTCILVAIALVLLIVFRRIKWL